MQPSPFLHFSSQIVELAGFLLSADESPDARGEGLWSSIKILGEKTVADGEGQKMRNPALFFIFFA